LPNPARIVTDGGRMTNSFDRKVEPMPAAIDSTPTISELARCPEVHSCHPG
jgi:hypothetical protein